MAEITSTYEVRVTRRSALDLAAASGILMVAGSTLITIAALLKWWPVSGIVLVVSAVLFWTFVALSAGEDPHDEATVLDLRRA